jgi:uncharacterized protein
LVSWDSLVFQTPATSHTQTLAAIGRDKKSNNMRIDRLTILLILVLCNNFSFAQENVNQLDDNGLRSGLWLDYYKNSRQIKWRYYYKDGKLDSLQISYYSDGKLKSRQMYSEGVKNGLFETYHSNGQLHETFNLKSGLLDGDYKFYYANGKLFREGTFKNDKDNGKSIRYYENGNKWIEELYKNGILDGEVKKYDKNGRLIKTLKFEKGKKIK